MLSGNITAKRSRFLPLLIEIHFGKFWWSVSVIWDFSQVVCGANMGFLKGWSTPWKFKKRGLKLGAAPRVGLS